MEDRSLVKHIQKAVKKMLKPFKGLNYDEFMMAEVHLNEVMAGGDEELAQLKESRKRHLRILDAALKEPIVDF